MDIVDLRDKIRVPYFDYQRLKDALKETSHERRAIGQLIKKQHIVRIKKGLYIWGPKLNETYSKEVLANLIYGPSYVSLEYALSFHNLIPERVETVTCITTKRNKEFKTPKGYFSYEHLHQNAFPWGQTLIEYHPKIFAIMATPEKAILDMLALKIKTKVKLRSEDFYDLLFEDLRIDEDDFNKLDRLKFFSLATYYKSSNVKTFVKFLENGGSCG